MRNKFKKYFHRRQDFSVSDKPVSVVGVWQNGQFVPADKKIKKHFM
jgi:hypothetical protein